MKLLRGRMKEAVKILLYGVTPQNVEFPSLEAGELDEIHSFFPRSKFFIFGHARSGTTLFARLIRLHPEVHCNWQAHFFTRSPRVTSLVSDPEVAAWLSRRHNRWNRGKDLSTVVLRTVCDFVLEREARQLNKQIVGDKSPNTDSKGEAVSLLKTVYPDGRLFVMVRDGRDAVLSQLFQDFVDHPEYLSRSGQSIRKAFLREPELFYRRERSLFASEDLRRRLMRWIENVDQTDSVARMLFGENYLSIRYEDLLLDPAGWMGKAWTFLSAGPADGLAQRIVSEMEIRPDASRQLDAIPPLGESVKKGGPGLWTEFFTPGDIEIVHSIAAGTLERFGYEL